MRVLRGGAWAVMIVLSLSACSGGEGSEALEEQMALIEADRDAIAVELDTVEAERDAMVSRAETQANRREEALRIMDELTRILDDHEAFGTQDEIANLIATHATETAIMDDDVFGGFPYRQAFLNTLYFGGADARIDVYASWLSDDGFQGGFLWMWSGTNPSGQPFELAGISLAEFADDGRISYERVTYPYPDEYVREAWLGDGTPILSTG